MGTSCVLRHPDDPLYKEYLMRDEETTTKEHGVRLVGYCLRKQNQLEEHKVEDYNLIAKKLSYLEMILKRLLTPV